MYRRVALNGHVRNDLLYARAVAAAAAIDGCPRITVSQTIF